MERWGGAATGSARLIAARSARVARQSGLCACNDQRPRDHTRALVEDGRIGEASCGTRQVCGPLSKPTSSISCDALARWEAMSVSDSVSGFSSPKLFTVSDCATPGFSGYSWLISA